MPKFLLVALLAGLCLQTHSQGLLDYCGLPNCHGKEHIVCQFKTQEWAPLCDTRVSYNMLNLRDVQGDMLNAMNTFRNKVAGGLESGYPKAAHMSTLVWNVTLANIARYNVRQCESKLDQCRNTPDYDFCGENVGWATFVQATEKRTNAQIIMDILEYWISQKQFGNEALVNSFSDNPGPERWNSAAQMMRDIPTCVGCAAVAMVRDDSLRTILLTCIFNNGLFKGKPVYKTSPTAASKCKAKHTTYKNLCATTEVFDVNAPELYF